MKRQKPIKRSSIRYTPKKFTAEQLRYRAEVRAMGCLRCRELGQPQSKRTALHHEQEGTYRREDRILPVCQPCHETIQANHKAYKPTLERWLKEVETHVGWACNPRKGKA